MGTTRLRACTTATGAVQIPSKFTPICTRMNLPREDSNVPAGFFTFCDQQSEGKTE